MKCYMARKKISYDLYGKLQLTTIEREVEDVYNDGISLFFADCPIQHPFNCDGFIEEGLMLRLLIEYKLDELLSNSVARAKILVQVLFYMKRFEEGGLALPNVIMVGDKNECFVIHSNDIVNYLDEDIDWSTAPSLAAEANARLVAKISGNPEINPYIFRIEPGFDIRHIIDRIRDLSVNVKRYVRVTEHNIAEIFDNFSSSVLKDPSHLSPHELVSVFLGILLEPLDYYQHPSNPNLLVAGGNRIPIWGDVYRAFFDYYNQSYTPQEKMKFTEIADRLIEDTTRRRNGEFFTPTSFVDYAHRVISTGVGEDWKERMYVWDCAAGTKNLTRDYRFSHLFCSTLNREDLDLSVRYNPEAESFVFDFLNGDLDSLPSRLKASFVAKMPFVFFINPPWGTANNAGAKGTSKAGMAKTAVNDEMLGDGLGSSAQNLYAQFLYRILKLSERYSLSECYIAVFSPTLFLTGPSWAPFRSRFFDRFEFVRGFQFNAAHFSNVRQSWGACFTLWRLGRQLQRQEFTLSLIERSGEGLVSTGDIFVYNMDGRMPASEWVREQVRGLPGKEYPNATSALNIDCSKRYRIAEGAIGYAQMKGNNVNENPTGVSLLTMMYANAHGVSVIPENLGRVCSLFAARKLVEKNWINSKNEYCVPDTGSPVWDEFVNDAIVFSLFNSSSIQTSLRGVEYGSREWNIPNGFFFMSREEIMSLANQYNNMDCYTDARTDTDRYVFTLLGGLELSEQAEVVLRQARRVVRETFEFRSIFNVEAPQFQINNWDAGWYQVRALASMYDKGGLAEFTKLYSALCGKMRPLVYRLGFLK